MRRLGQKLEMPLGPKALQEQGKASLSSDVSNDEDINDKVEEKSLVEDDLPVPEEDGMHKDEEPPVFVENEERAASFEDDGGQADTEYLAGILEAESVASFDGESDSSESSHDEAVIDHKKEEAEGENDDENVDFHVEAEPSQESTEKELVLTYGEKELRIISGAFDGFDLPDEFFQEELYDVKQSHFTEDTEAFCLSPEEAKKIQQSVEEKMKKPTGEESETESAHNIKMESGLNNLIKKYPSLTRVASAMFLTTVLAYTSGCATTGRGGNPYYEVTKDAQKKVRKVEKTIRNVEGTSRAVKKISKSRDIKGLLRNIGRALGSVGRTIR